MTEPASSAESLGALVDESDSGDLPRLSSYGEDFGAGEAAQAVRLPNPAPYYLVAAFISVLVLLAPVVFAWSYQRDMAPFRNDVFSLVMVALLALGPAALVWLMAFVLQQTARMAVETRIARAMTDQLSQPITRAARGAGSAIEQVRQEIAHAVTVTAQARTELLSLREILAVEAERLIEATEGSHRTAGKLTRDLGAEREKMHQMAGVLDAQAAGVAEAIGRHARMVAEASDLAETQLREAEASLTARAADFAAAAGEASDTARIAGEDLSRQIARLETASQGVGDQSRLLESGLTEQRAALVTVAHGLRADHEAFAAEAETHLAKLSEVVVHAREGASVVSESAASGAGLLNQLLTGVGAQLANLVDSIAHERDFLSASAAQSLGAISEIAARERQAMEEQAQATVDHILSAAGQARREIEAQAALITDERGLLGSTAAQSLTVISEVAARERDQIEAQARKTVEAVVAAAEAARRAMESQAETARDKVDQLSEAAFAAGQRAESVFEARLNEARGLIEQSAQLVDQAGAASAVRLGEGVGAARTTLNELERLLNDVDTRIARLPTDAQARAETVRATIERGMEDMMASARRAAEETQNIDAAFQDRVRRNYDMLSEAVRLMGVVAGAAGSSPRPASPLSTPRAPAPSPEPEARTAEPRLPPRTPDAWPDPARAAEPSAPEAATVADAGLRPRLRLTPTASDEEFKQVFEAAGGREPARKESRGEAAASGGGDGWTWKELLSSMDDEPVVDETQLSRLVLSEIETMGIDAGALLPRARVEEFSALAQAGDLDAVRANVSRLAPAAIRRLARRLISDRAFRANSDRFVQRYQGLIADAVRRSDDGVVVSALLGSDQGRAYLLFDAAMGETP